MKQTCPYKVRGDLPPLTVRLKALPVDKRGYPVPFFVAMVNGEPEFRIADEKKLAQCVNHRLCWVCGQPLGAYKAFTVGPMCCVNRTSSEPPAHRDCAEWSVKGCPFLARPHMVRREDELTKALDGNIAGIPILRNPGVIAVWVTQGYSLFNAHGVLFNMHEPLSVTWWREGRLATKAEVLDAIQEGLPALTDVATKDRHPIAAMIELTRQVTLLQDNYLPKK